MSPDRAREGAAARLECLQALATIERVACKLHDATERAEVDILAHEIRDAELRARLGVAALSRMLEIDAPLHVVLHDNGAASGPGVIAKAGAFDEQKPAPRELAGETGR